MRLISKIKRKQKKIRKDMDEKDKELEDEIALISSYIDHVYSKNMINRIKEIILARVTTDCSQVVISENEEFKYNTNTEKGFDTPRYQIKEIILSQRFDQTDDEIKSLRNKMDSFMLSEINTKFCVRSDHNGIPCLYRKFKLNDLFFFELSDSFDKEGIKLVKRNDKYYFMW